MGDINWLGVVLGAVAFFAVGALWYSVLFGKVWQREVGLSDEQLKSGANMGVIFGTCFLLELLVSWALGHEFAIVQPTDRQKLMIAIGTGAAFMSAAIGINYLYMRRSLKLFAIDAGHFIVGMAAMGGVYALLD